MAWKPDKHVALEGVYALRGISAMAAFYSLAYLPGWVMVLAIVSVMIFVTAGWIEDRLVDKINIENWEKQQEEARSDDVGQQ